MTNDILKTYSICTECNQVNRVPVISPDDKTAVCGKCHSALHFHEAVTALSSPTISLLSRKIPLPLVVDFWASWCRPCHAFAPTFKQAAKTLGGKVVFGKVNVEANPLASDHYYIQGIPSLLIFNDGVEVARQSGVMSLKDFLSWIDQASKIKNAA
jgi:thioredoxin 2